MIDVHAHCVPAQLLETLRRDGGRHRVALTGTDDGFQIQLGSHTSAALPGALIDVGNRLTAMDRTGVTRQLLSPWMELMARELDADDALWFARAYNDALASMVAATPDRFDALAMLPLREPPAAAAELRRAVTELGLAGAEIATSATGVDPSSAAFTPLWHTASELAAFMLMHPRDPLGSDRYPTDRLPDIVGNPAESTAAVGRLLLSGLLRRLPDLTICVVHGGGFLPYQAGRFSAIAAIAALDQRPWPTDWFAHDARQLYFDSLTHSEQTLRWLVEFAGAGHVLVGSDYPFPTGCPDPVGAVSNVGALSVKQQTAILHDNAAHLLAAVHR